MDDEAKIRLGLDITPLDVGLRNARQKMEVFAGGLKGIAHGARRDFHKAMHEIADQSPMVGLALKAALSPIGAALSAGVMLFTYVHQKLEEFNVEMDKQAASAALPIDNMRAAFERAEEKINKYKKEYKAWIESHDHTVNAIVDGLKNQIALLEHQKKLLNEIIDLAKQRAIAEGKDPKQVEASASKIKELSDYKTLMAEVDARAAANKSLKSKRDAAGRDISDTLSLLENPRLQATADADSLKEAKKKYEDSQTAFPKEKQDQLGELEDKYSKAKVAAKNWWMPWEKVEAVMPSGLEDLRRLKAERDQAAKILLDKTKAQKSSATQVSGLEARLKKSEGLYDSYGNQISSNREAMDALGMKREEMLGGMTPEQAKQAILDEALQHSMGRGAAAAQLFARNHDGGAYQKELLEARKEYYGTVQNADKLAADQLKKLDAMHKTLTEGLPVIIKDVLVP